MKGRSMPYTTEWQPTKLEDRNFVCRNCGSYDVEYREWESSDGGHEDTHYSCNNCKFEWWVEGTDS